MAQITDIKEHLEVLSLRTTHVPTLKEYKQAYRQLMKLHPDLGGDTAQFQEITLAARTVFEFITTHHSDARPDNDEDNDLIKAFEASNKVDYNNGNVVFGIDPKESSLWVQCLTKRLGKPLPLDNGNALQFRIEDYRIPKQSSSIKTNYGNVIVTLWPNPKTTSPKAMVQGKCHMAFITFTLPLIIKDIKTASKPPKATGAIEQIGDSDEEAVDEECNSATTVTSKALGRLEQELLIMRNDMSERLEAVLQTKPAPDFTHLDRRLGTLEDLLRQNNEQHTKLTSSIDNLRDSLIKNSGHVQLDQEQLEHLAKEISSSHNNQITELSTTVSAIRSEMALASSLSAVQDKVDIITPVLDTVHSAALKIDYNVNDLRKEVTKTS